MPPTIGSIKQSNTHTPHGMKSFGISESKTEGTTEAVDDSAASKPPKKKKTPHSDTKTAPQLRFKFCYQPAA
jgi:hypothetical protein